MIKVKDVCAALERWAPQHIQESWDNAGLCTGNPEDDVVGVIFALDCTQEVVDEAVEAGYNMIVTHHPLIFRPVRNLREDCPKNRLIASILRNNIAVYSAHTNADKIPSGVSASMAKALDLQDIQILSPDPENPGDGLGMVGNLKDEIPVEEFLARLKVAFNLSSFRYSRPCLSTVSRVAVCGGSGASLIGEAISSGAGVFVCADLGFHDFLENSGQIVLADIGHYESEVGILLYFKDVLTKKFSNFAARITRTITNPILYY